MIVTIVHNLSSYEFAIENPEMTTIGYLKKLSTSVFNCYNQNIKLVYSGVEIVNTVYLSEFNRNNITLYAAIVPIKCKKSKNEHNNKIIE